MATAIIDTSSASTLLVAAPGAGKFIRIRNFIVTASGATVFAFKDGDGAAVSGPNYSTAANGGSAMVGQTDSGGLLDLPINKALYISNSLTQPLGGFVNYSIVGL